MVALGIHQSAMENSDEQLKYSRKTRDLQLLQPPAVRGLTALSGGVI